MSIIEQLARPVIFAHRGASARAPENTLAAFELAIQSGAPAIELDVKLTSDRQVVVLHDATLDRTTNGKGKLSDHTLEQVRALDAGSNFSADYSDQAVPSLAEVFQTVGQRAFLNIEFTNYTTPTDDLVDRVITLVYDYHMSEQVMFSSFNPIALGRANRLLPEVPLGLITLRGAPGSIVRNLGGLFTSYQALHPQLTDVDRKIIERTHRSGRRVHAWTANQSDDVCRLADLGVDGMMTDDPAMALSQLRGQR